MAVLRLAPMPAHRDLDATTGGSSPHLCLRRGRSGRPGKSQADLAEKSGVSELPSPALNLRTASSLGGNSQPKKSGRQSKLPGYLSSRQMSVVSASAFGGDHRKSARAAGRCKRRGHGADLNFGLRAPTIWWRVFRWSPSSCDEGKRLRKRAVQPSAAN